MLEPMRLLTLFATLSTSMALAQTATPAAPALPVQAPVLQEGQIWHLTVPPINAKDKPWETDLILGKIVALSTGVQGSKREFSKSGPLTDEIFSYTDDGAALPYFLIVRMGVKVTTLYVQFCAVSQPHDRLNEPQVGVWGEGADMQGYQPVGKFLATRVIGQARSCTLTRTK